MNIKRFVPILAVGMLTLSALACNFGIPAGSTQIPGGGSGNETAVPTEAPATEAPATEAPAQNAGACQNPYLPVIVGATWDYNLTGPIPDTFTRSIVSVEANGFTDQDVFGTGITRQGKWTCDSGNLTALNPSGNSASVNSENVIADFQTTSSSGITLPASIGSGDTWSQATTIEGTEHISNQDIPAKNEFSNSCTAAGVESVTVTAGTFDAMRFDCQTTTNITVTVLGSPIQTSLSFTATSWYAENIGLIKTVTSGSGLDSTIELLSYTVP